MLSGGRGWGHLPEWHLVNTDRMSCESWLCGTAKGPLHTRTTGLHLKVPSMVGPPRWLRVHCRGFQAHPGGLQGTHLVGSLVSISLSGLADVIPPNPHSRGLRSLSEPDGRSV